MPNTLAHIGLQVAGFRIVGVRSKDLGFVFLGCVIPDLPWILRRIILVFDVSEQLTLFAYSSIQSSLLFCLVFVAAITSLVRGSGRAFAIAGASCAFHLILDALQIKWANGVLLFAPFDWQISSWGKYWPESAVSYVLTAAGTGVIASAFFRTRHQTISIQLARRRLMIAGTLIAVWMIVPLVFVSTAFQENNHFLQTLRDTEGRPGQYIEFDRCNVSNRDSKWYVKTIADEEIELVASRLAESGVYSIAGVFKNTQQIELHKWHRHSAFRDVASLAGLSSVLLWFGILAVQRYLPKLRASSELDSN